MVYLTYYLIGRDFILKSTQILKRMIFDYINEYETHKTLETAIALCQFLMDTDQTSTHEGRKYKTLCNYLLLEGCLYDVGAWDEYMKLESWLTPRNIPLDLFLWVGDIETDLAHTIDMRECISPIVILF